MSKGVSGEIKENQGVSGKIREVPQNEHSYKRLVVWKNAYKLRLLVYRITKKFPKSEMRRVYEEID